MKQRGKTEDQVEYETMQKLIQHAFPGNIREMENLLERALILAGDEALSPHHFPSLSGGQGVEKVGREQRRDVDRGDAVAIGVSI